MEMNIEGAQVLKHKTGKEMFTNLGHTQNMVLHPAKKILRLETNSLLNETYIPTENDSLC